MIVHHHSPLRLGITDGLHRIRVIYEIVVSGKQSIEMSDIGPVSRDFRTGDYGQAIFLSLGNRLLDNKIKVNFVNLGFIWLTCIVFKVLIEFLSACIPYAR